MQLWGTRGSLPTSGLDTLRYGGNTSCVEVTAADGTPVILDAGSGIRALGIARGCHEPRTDILLTHLHSDHLLGIGFFRPVYDANCEVHIWGPPSQTLDLRAQLDRIFSPPLFPTPLRELPCRLELHEVPRGDFEIGGLRVSSDLVCHSGVTVGYRLMEEGATLAYMPDHEPALGSVRFPSRPEWTSGFDLARGADVLIHDSQYDMYEYNLRVGWGHSAVQHTIQFADFAGASRLVTFHHEPSHDDATTDRILEEALLAVPHSCEVIRGVEAAIIDAGRPPPARTRASRRS